MDISSSAYLNEIDDPDTSSWISGVHMREDDGFIESPEKMLADCMARVTGAGLLKSSTIEQIKKLEQAGQKDIAEQMRVRAKKKSSSTHQGEISVKKDNDSTIITDSSDKADSFNKEDGSFYTGFRRFR